jgi:transcriptional regulator with XRE-family HTH domain
VSGNRKRVALAFGEGLRAARRERGMSQDELSERCDFDRTYPSLLERGLRHPTLRMLLHLADALGTPPEFLVTDTAARLSADSVVRQ